MSETMKVTASQFTVTEYREVSKGTLVAFLTLELPSGMLLRDCSYNRKPDGSRWINTPSRRFEKHDGTTVWVKLVDFTDKQTYEKFQTAAKAAVDRYLVEHQAEELSVGDADVPAPKKVGK